MNQDISKMIMTTILVEGIITYFNEFFVSGNAPWQMILSLILGIVIAMAYKLDLPKYLGSNFSTVEKTGGNKNHRHEFRIGMHWWYGAACGEGSGNSTGAYRFSDNQYDGWARELSGMSLPVNNAAYNNSSTTTQTPSGKWSKGDTSNTSHLPPYITCYMWKRTA